MFSRDLNDSRLRQLLDRNCPSPESQLIRLSLRVSALPNDVRGAHARHLMFDIDDLVAQSRWHLAEALRLLEQYPELTAPPPEGKTPHEQMRQQHLLPSEALLLLRGYIVDADKVVFDDLAEQRRGGTAAGWIFHMMIDSSIVRSIAALDRLARLLWYLADLPLEHASGTPVRVYFRSGKMKQIHDKLLLEPTAQLLEIAGNPFLEYVTSYRDGLVHDLKAYTSIAGSRPTDRLQAPDGSDYWLEGVSWTADDLFALGNATYHYLCDSLGLCEAACGSKWQLPPEATGA